MTWVLNYTMPCCLTFAHWLPISSQWLALNRVSLNHISYCYTLDDRPYFVILVHYCVFILFIYFKLLGARSSYLYCYSLPTISLASRRLMSVRHRLHQHWRKAILIQLFCWCPLSYVGFSSELSFGVCSLCAAISFQTLVMFEA